MTHEKILAMLESDDPELANLGIIALMSAGADSRGEFIKSNFERSRGAGQYYVKNIRPEQFMKMLRKGMFGKAWIRGDYCIFLSSLGYIFHNVRAKLKINDLNEYEKIYI